MHAALARTVIYDLLIKILIKPTTSPAIGQRPKEMGVELVVVNSKIISMSWAQVELARSEVSAPRTCRKQCQCHVQKH